MTEKELKDEIKRLKEKLKKKSKRVSDLMAENKKAIKAREHWYDSYQKERDLYWAIKKNFPDKYYRVEWSGVDKSGNRMAPTIQLKTGPCAAFIIEMLQRRYTNAEIHMIEEVAT